VRRFKNILVAAPGDTDLESTLTLAASVATANDARLTLFDVVAPFPSRRTGRLNPDLARYLQRLVGEQRELQLEDLARTTIGRPTAVDIGVGTPFIEITRRVQIHGHDLVITPPDQPSGRLGLGRASTTMHLLRKCPVPVWVHRPEIRDRSDVLAAVGPFPDDEPTPLDRKIIELATSLGARLGGTVHITHAWELEGESLLRHGRSRIAADEVDALVQDAFDAAHNSVAKLLAETGISSSDVNLEIVQGRPKEVLPAVARRVKPSVVVMGTASRSGIAGLLIGNTAESVLNEIDCSVLAVKPDGFVSPIGGDSSSGPW
jgi:universal stress protein E